MSNGDCGIYIIKNVLDGRLYVGQSQYIKRRIRTHINNLSKNKETNVYLQRAWNKYGSKAFVTEVIECCDIDKLNEREIYWIATLKSLSSQNGYNISFGGDAPMRGRKHSKKTIAGFRKSRLGRKLPPMSEEQKLKMSLARRGELNWNWGKKHSPKTIAKMIKNNAHNVPSFTKEQREEQGNNRRGKNKKRKTSTIYKGVTFHQASNKWRARVIDHRKEFYLGVHTTQEDAARAFDKFCWEKYKKKEMLNFPDEYE